MIVINISRLRYAWKNEWQEENVKHHYALYYNFIHPFFFYLLIFDDARLWFFYIRRPNLNLKLYHLALKSHNI